MDALRFDGMARRISVRVTRRSGFGLLTGASLLLGLGSDTDAKKKKKVTLCDDGQTVKVPKKKAKKLLQQGATKGACPEGCPAGQKQCGAICISNDDCCNNTDCTGTDVCQGGECVPLPCGDGGPCVVFVNSFATIGKFTGGIVGADALCQTSAGNNPALSGRTFRAWLSDDGSTPSTRWNNLNNAGPYVLVGNNSDVGAPPQVAASFLDLLGNCGNVNPFPGCLEHAINRSETGSESVSTEVWTGTNRNGTASTGNNCVSWTDDNSPTALVGVTSSTNGSWTESSVQTCGGLLRSVYCFEQAS